MLVNAKKLKKRCKSMKSIDGFSLLRDIAQSTEVNKGDSWILRFSALFSRLVSFLSPQMGSGSCKNSHRKLRHHFIKSDDFWDEFLHIHLICLSDRALGSGKK